MRAVLVQAPAAAVHDSRPTFCLTTCLPDAPPLPRYSSSTCCAVWTVVNNEDENELKCECCPFPAGGAPLFPRLLSLCSFLGPSYGAWMGHQPSTPQVVPDPCKDTSV